MRMFATSITAVVADTDRHAHLVNGGRCTASDYQLARALRFATPLEFLSLTVPLVVVPDNPYEDAASNPQIASEMPTPSTPKLR